MASLLGSVCHAFRWRPLRSFTHSIILLWRLENGCSSTAVICSRNATRPAGKLNLPCIHVDCFAVSTARYEFHHWNLLEYLLQRREPAVAGRMFMKSRYNSSQDGRCCDLAPLPIPIKSTLLLVSRLQMAVLACLRQNSIRPFTPHSSVTVSAGEAVGRSLANTATLFLLEISVVFQTIVVPLSW